MKRLYSLRSSMIAEWKISTFSRFSSRFGFPISFVSGLRFFSSEKSGGAKIVSASILGMKPQSVSRFSSLSIATLIIETEFVDSTFGGRFLFLDFDLDLEREWFLEEESQLLVQGVEVGIREGLRKVSSQSLKLELNWIAPLPFI